MTYRVIRWGVGNVGAEALGSIIDNPVLELAGVWTHSETKSGMDAGELCRHGRTGISVTSSLADIVGIDADCVVYAPRIPDLDEVCALLRSGKNVLCAAFLFYAEALPENERKRIRDACRTGNSSLYGSGINPGFVGMVLPVAMSGMSRRIRKASVIERANWSFCDNPRITFDNIKFGSSPEQASIEANSYARFVSSIFQDQIHMLAAAWGVQLDRVDTVQDLIASEKDFDIMSGSIAKGTVSGQRYQWIGHAGGRAIIDIDALWTVGDQYPENWPTPADDWTVQIEGEPSMLAHFLCMASLDPNSPATLADHVHATELATAMQVVNSIPAVCAAPPGILGAHELTTVHCKAAFQ